MHESKLLVPDVLWWPRPKVWPTSWHITCCLVYAVMEYESFILAVPCTMWPPLVQIEAKPIQPVWPYALLQTFTRPLVAGQVLVVGTSWLIFVTSWVESLQSFIPFVLDVSADPAAVARRPFQASVVRLLSTPSVNSPAPRPQW